jgi:hypothetical protein
LRRAECDYLVRATCYASTLEECEHALKELLVSGKQLEIGSTLASNVKDVWGVCPTEE